MATDHLADTPHLLCPLFPRQPPSTQLLGNLRPPSHTPDSTAPLASSIFLAALPRHLPRHAGDVEFLAFTVCWPPINAVDLYWPPFFLVCRCQGRLPFKESKVWVHYCITDTVAASSGIDRVQCLGRVCG